MKKFFSNIRTLAALLMAGAAFGACSSNDENIIEQQPVTPGEQVYTLTISASKDGATTRALSLDGTALKTSWTTTDVISVLKGTTAVGTLSPKDGSISDDGQSATFTGSISGVDVDDVLTLAYHPITGLSSFATQTGTLASASDFDNAIATVTVGGISGSDITIKETSASFKTQTAVVKLTLSDGSNAINATSVKLSVAGANLFTFTPTADTYTANGDGILYFALPSAAAIATAKGTTTTALAALPITITAHEGTKIYTCSKTGYTFAAGTYYATTLTMAIPTLNMTSPVVGQVIGEDGKNYAYAGLPSGMTAVAKICYVSGSNGLALAMADDSPSNWSTAITTAEAHTPTFAGGTWKLATKGEWNNMINAAGSYTALGAFSSVGGEDLQGYYWSSSSISDTNASAFYFHNGSWNSLPKTYSSIRVRACLAF